MSTYEVDSSIPCPRKKQNIQYAHHILLATSKFHIRFTDSIWAVPCSGHMCDRLHVRTWDEISILLSGYLGGFKVLMAPPGNWLVPAAAAKTTRVTVYPFRRRGRWGWTTCLLQPQSSVETSILHRWYSFSTMSTRGNARMGISVDDWSVHTGGNIMLDFRLSWGNGSKWHCGVLMTCRTSILARWYIQLRHTTPLVGMILFSFETWRWSNAYWIVSKGKYPTGWTERRFCRSSLTTLSY